MISTQTINYWPKWYTIALLSYMSFLQGMDEEEWDL